VDRIGDRNKNDSIQKEHGLGESGGHVIKKKAGGGGVGGAIVTGEKTWERDRKVGHKKGKKKGRGEQ